MNENNIQQNISELLSEHTECADMIEGTLQFYSQKIKGNILMHTNIHMNNFIGESITGWMNHGWMNHGGWDKSSGW